MIPRNRTMSGRSTTSNSRVRRRRNLRSELLEDRRVLAPMLIAEMVGRNTDGNHVFQFSVNNSDVGAVAIEMAWEVGSDGLIVESPALGAVAVDHSDDASTFDATDPNYDANNDTWWYRRQGTRPSFATENPGHNPFTESITNGYWTNASSTGNTWQLFLSVGSETWSSGLVNNVPLLQLVTTATTISWSGIIAANGINFNISGSQIITDPPVTQPDSYTLTEDSLLTVASGNGVLANDSDPQSLPMAADLVGSPANGQVSLNSDGSFTYTPNPNFFGSDSFSYAATNVGSSSAPTIVTLNVTGVDDRPVAVPDSATVAAGETLRWTGKGVLENDIEPDLEEMTAVLFGNGTQHGTLTLQSSGGFQYIPDVGFFGQDSFRYVAVDPQVNLSTPVTVTIDVTLVVPPRTLNVRASDGIYTDRVALQWDPTPLATSYEVWRNTTNNLGSATRIVNSHVTTTFDDVTAGRTETYYYWIKPRNEVGTGIISAVESGYRRRTDYFRNSGQQLPVNQNHSAAVGDLDGDGDLDAFLVSGSGGARVWSNDSYGFFSDTGQRLGNDNQVYATLADVDNDGDLDAYAAAFGQDRLFVNDGGGVFVESVQAFPATYTNEAAFADIDDDGDLDLILASFDVTQANSVWWNDGSGNFVKSPQQLEFGRTAGVAASDLDGDSDIDIFFVKQSGSNSVWLNDGSGQFSVTSQVFPVTDSRHISLADLDADGDVDGVENTISGQRVWLNDGTGIMVDSGQRLGTEATSAATLLDVELDGDLDFVDANWFQQPNHLWLNDGNGNFSDSGQTMGTATSSHIPVGDIDGDGDLDLLVANFSDGASEVWFNNQIDFNLPPIPADDSGFVVQEDTLLTINDSNLLANDFDPNRDAMTIVAVDSTSSLGATVVRLPNGTIRMDPRNVPGLQSLPQNVSVADTFVYTVNDSRGASGQGEVTVIVQGANDAPVADNDTINVAAAGGFVDITAQLLQGDVDMDQNETALLRVIGGNLVGTAGEVVFTNGRVRYSPSQAYMDLGPNETRQDRFSYTISDPFGAQSTAEVTINVRGPGIFPGDYNRNLVVDAADYTVWKDSFSSTTDLAADGNRDGTVNAADYTIWKDNFGNTLPPSGIEAVAARQRTARRATTRINNELPTDTAFADVANTNWWSAQSGQPSITTRRITSSLANSTSCIA